MFKTRWSVLACLAVLAFAAIGIGTTRATTLLRREAFESQQQLAATENDLLLVLQQTTELAKQYVTRFDGQELSDQDKTLLRTWLLYNEQFSANHGMLGSFRFERAISAQRAADIALLLEEYERAEEQSALCEKMLEQLAKENPSVFSYQGLRMENLANLAVLRLRSGNQSGAGECFQKALNVLDLPTLSRSHDANIALGSPLEMLTKIALKSGRLDVARRYCLRLVKANDELVAAHPTRSEFQQRATEARNLLSEIPTQ